MAAKTVIGVVLLLAILGGGWYLFSHSGSAPAPVVGTNSNTLNDTLVTPGGLGFRYATSTYSLATHADQVSVKSYIPPCDQDFDYCIYRIDDTYKGTNFESAGLRIKERTDLKSKDACLTAPPSSFTNMTPKVREGQSYSTSVFAPIGDAGAGHYAAGALYRLSSGTACYEFETRIGETQFSNYLAGSVKKFTDDDRAAVYAELVGILNTAQIVANHAPVVFPSLDDGMLPGGSK